MTCHKLSVFGGAGSLAARPRALSIKQRKRLLQRLAGCLPKLTRRFTLSSASGVLSATCIFLLTKMKRLVKMFVPDKHRHSAGPISFKVTPARLMSLVRHVTRGFSVSCGRITLAQDKSSRYQGVSKAARWVEGLEPGHSREVGSLTSCREAATALRTGWLHTGLDYVARCKDELPTIRQDGPLRQNAELHHRG